MEVSSWPRAVRNLIPRPRRRPTTPAHPCLPTAPVGGGRGDDSEPWPGDATLVVRDTAIDGSHVIDGAVYGGYDLYTDSGQYYDAPDSLAELQQPDCLRRPVIDGVDALKVDFPDNGQPEIIWLNAGSGVPIQEQDGSDSATTFEVKRVTAAGLPSLISLDARLR